MICERCKHEIESIPLVEDLSAFVRELRLESLPSLPIERYEDLPLTAAVYFALHDGAAVYIGQSGCLSRRWRHHPKLKRFLAAGGYVAWVEVREEQLRDVEKVAIAYFKPAWNAERRETQRWECDIGDTLSPPVMA